MFGDPQLAQKRRSQIGLGVPLKWIGPPPRPKVTKVINVDKTKKLLRKAETGYLVKAKKTVDVVYPYGVESKKNERFSFNFFALLRL